jgi:outer membrane protein insertion porin family
VRFRGLKRSALAGLFGFGNGNHLGKHELKGALLKTRNPSWLPWRERPTLRLDYLSADTASIAALSRHYGYLDARVHWVLESTRDPEAAHVVFVIEEGLRSRIGGVDLQGVHAFRSHELTRTLLSRPGRPFDPAFLGIDTLRLSTLYQERGYRPHTLAGYARGIPESLKIAVRYDVNEGPRYTIGRIDYQGTGQLREQLARRELLLRPGDVYRRSRLERSVQHLYDTGLYSQIQVSSLVDSSGERLDLRLRVAERRPRWVDLGVGSGSADLFRFSGAWGHRNLDSKALLGSLNGDLTLDRQRRDPESETRVLRVRYGRASANLVEPWLLGLRLQGQSSLFYEQSSDDRDARFLQRRDSRGVELGMLREFSNIFHGSLIGHSALVHQSYDIFLVLPDTTADSLSRVLQRYFDNGVALSLFRDTRDDRITPTRGSLQTLVAEMAGGPLRGSSSYQKLTFVSSWYTPRTNGWLWAFRFSGGAMGPTGEPDTLFAPGTQDFQVARVPKERRFFIGGVNSLRGFGENSVPADGGLAMLLANAELRIPVWGPLGLEAFVDAGNVWARPEHVRLANFVAPWDSRQGQPADVRYTCGVGARLLLPFGPLRMDLSWSRHPDFVGSKVFGVLRPFNVQLAIGPSF